MFMWVQLKSLGVSWIKFGPYLKYTFIIIDFVLLVYEG